MYGVDMTVLHSLDSSTKSQYLAMVLGAFDSWSKIMKENIHPDYWNFELNDDGVAVDEEGKLNKDIVVIFARDNDGYYCKLGEGLAVGDLVYPITDLEGNVKMMYVIVFLSCMDKEIEFKFSNYNLIHGIGHALGIGHSDSLDSVMFYVVRIPNLDSPRITGLEVKSLQHLYGSDGFGGKNRYH